MFNIFFRYGIISFAIILTNCYAQGPVTKRPKYAPRGEKHKNVYDELKRKQGLHKFYTPQGILLWEIEYVDDKKHGFSKRYFSNTGKLREEANYFNGKKDGEYRKYNNRDKLIEEGSYKDGKRNGHWVKYHGITGEIIREGNYVKGQQNGEWKYYAPKGGLYLKGKYNMGKKEGKWEYFDTSSNVIKTEFYKDGLLYNEAEEQKKVTEQKKGKQTTTKTETKK